MHSAASEALSLVALRSVMLWLMTTTGRLTSAITFSLISSARAMLQLSGTDTTTYWPSVPSMWCSGALKARMSGSS